MESYFNQACYILFSAACLKPIFLPLQFRIAVYLSTTVANITFNPTARGPACRLSCRLLIYKGFANNLKPARDLLVSCHLVGHSLFFLLSFLYRPPLGSLCLCHNVPRGFWASFHFPPGQLQFWCHSGTAPHQHSSFRASSWRAVNTNTPPVLCAPSQLTALLTELTSKWFVGDRKSVV